MSVYKRGKSWYIDSIIDGVRIHRKGGRTRAAAEQIDEELRTDSRRKKLSLPRIINDSETPFIYLAEEYFLRAAAVKASSTYKVERNFYENHIRPFFSDLMASDICDPLLLDFQTHLCAKQVVRGYQPKNPAIVRPTAPMGPRTVNICIGIVRKIINHAMQKQIMHAATFKYPHLKEPKRLHAFFDFDEWEALLASARELHPQIVDRIEVARDAGLRPAEHAYLAWSTDIDFSNRLIRITGKPGLWEPKTWEERVIPMTANAYAILKRRYKQRTGPWVFSDGPAPVVNIKNSLKACAAHAGIEKKVGANMLRHTFATHGLMGGIKSKSISEIMGHKDERTTARYLHAIQDGLAAEIALLDRKKRGRKSKAVPTKSPQPKKNGSPKGA